MPKPVINTTSSILGFLQWQEFEFQPLAINSPAGWTASALPTGVSINATTGLISGAAEKPGVYVVHLRASNVDGVSSPVKFTFGIEASAGDPSANVIDLKVDMGTRDVTPYLGATVADALFSAKYRDEIILRVQFHRNGAPVAGLDLDALKFAIKEWEPESVLAESSLFHDAGDGVYLIYISLDDADLETALLNYEGDKETFFPAVCEIEWVANNSLGSGSSFPATLRGSSKHFTGHIVRDLNQLVP